MRKISVNEIDFQLNSFLLAIGDEQAMCIAESEHRVPHIMSEKIMDREPKSQCITKPMYFVYGKKKKERKKNCDSVGGAASLRCVLAVEFSIEYGKCV